MIVFVSRDFATCQHADNSILLSAFIQKSCFESMYLLLALFCQIGQMLPNQAY